MKKILSLFALVLLSCMGAWAQTVVQAPKVSTATTHYYYTFHCESKEAHLTDHCLSEVEGTIIGRATESTRFEFETADGGFYMKSVESGKYVNWTGSAATLTDTPETTWTISPVTDGHGCKSVGLIPSGYTQSLNNNVNTSPYLQLRAYGATNYCSLWCMQEYVEGSVTNLAELSNDKTYTIRSNRRGWWTGKAESNNIWQTNGIDDHGNAFAGESGKTQDATDKDQQWAILKSNQGNYYLYNVGQKKFFASSDTYATANAKAILSADVNGGVVLSFDEGAHFTGAEAAPAVRWAIGKKVGTTNHFFGVTNWHGQSWQVFENNTDYATGTDEGMYFAIVACDEFAGDDQHAALAAIEAFENTPVPDVFPSEGTYYMTIANHETGRNPYLYNDLDEATGYTLQAANLDNKTNGYIWRVTSDGNGNITEIVSGTGKGIVPNSTKFTGELTSLKYASTTNKGYYYLTSDAIKAAGDHECLNASNGGQNNGHGIRTVTTWTGAGHADNHWKFDVEDLTDKFVYDVVIAAGAPAGAYAEFNGQKALNGGFFVVGGSDLVNPTAATVAGYDVDVKVENQTITVTYTQTATSVDVDYNIYVDDTKVATVTRSEFEGVAPSFTFNAPAYVTVTQDVPATITAGVTSYDIKTTYNETLPFKLDGTKYNIKENRSNPLWIFYDGSALKTIAGQVPTYSNQDNYKWTFGGDWYNGFTLKNVAESKYVTFESVNPNNKDAVLTETLGAGAYFDLVQNGTFNYLKIHGTTVDAYISNRGGADKQELTHWNSSGNIGDAGAQLLITEAEEIAAPTFTFTPEEGKYYSLKVKGTDLYVNINTTTAESEAKQVVLGTEPEGFRFTATTGGYHVQNVSDLYIGGYSNAWNMNASTPEVWTIEIAEDGIMLLCAEGHMGLDDVVAGKAFYRNKGGVVFIVEEVGTPVTPAAPVEYVSEIKNKNTYAIVNIQAQGHNWYLKNAEGTLTTADATGVNAETEWTEDAQFVAELQNDGCFAFKNVANGQYLAWKGTANRADNTGANSNKGFVEEVNQYSTWTMHDGTRFPDTFWFVAKRGNDTDGSLIIKGENGAWDAWGNSENNTAAAFSNNYGFVLVKENTTPDWEGLEYVLNKAKSYPIGERLGEYYYEVVSGVTDNETWYDLLDYCNTLNVERTADKDEVDYAIEGLEEMIDALQLNMPQKGQMLFIKTSNDWISDPTYLYNEESTAKAGRLAFAQPTNEYDEAFRQAATWIYDGQFLVNYNNGLTASNNSGFMNIDMYPNTTKVEFLPAANGAIGKYNIRFASSRYLYTNKGLYTDAAGSTDATEGYNFELEDATYYFFLDFGTNGWASGYFPIPVAASPEYGIEAAYYIKNDPENDCFQAEPVGYEGRGLIAPFTPVIIKVNSEINGGRPLVKGAPDYSMQPEESALSGALWKQETPANCCVFNVVGGQPGFYGYTGATLKHCKAYYEPATPAASALRINFGEDNTLTGIMEAIEKAEFNGNVYDLQGRRINGVQKGVFVKDGKKIVK